MNEQNRLIYLDHAATTPVDRDVLNTLRETGFGNASSLYSLGRDNREAIEEARIRLARLIGS